VTLEQLQPYAKDGLVKQAAAGEDTIEASLAAPKSPGMKYAHYAPRGILTLVMGAAANEVQQKIQKMIDAAKEKGETTGILTCREHIHQYRADLVVPCGSLEQPETIAHELFAALRSFDNASITYIAAEAFAEAGIGSAVMNRLMKAAGQRIIRI
jgi:L-threonylcarbamoyladenylate synthase